MHNPTQSTDTPFIIAGPCSVESKEQLTEIVSQFNTHNEINLIRCGIWKPRTRPGGFEGLGEPALRWIQELKQEYPQARFCCEVARPEHVELCRQYGIDGMWIGARTSGDPFSMKEITEALRGCQQPIFIKNPLTPDVKAWIGAIERCRQVGINQIAAIHRGFDMYNNLGFRNHPLWEVAIELRRIIPEIPILCDPSHIGGRRDLIKYLSQTALDLDFNGLMIEVHPNPEQAITDAEQQITPKDLFDLLKTILVRNQQGDGNEELKLLRSQIDSIDEKILKLLAQRIETSRNIADVKQHHNMTIYQPKRWDDVLHQRMMLGEKLGLSDTFVKEIYEKIHAESVQQQENYFSTKE